MSLLSWFILTTPCFYLYFSFKKLRAYDFSLLLGLTLSGFGVMLTVAILYLFSNVYLDHVEPSIASIAYTSGQLGQPAHHGDDYSRLYQFPHGPGLFVLNYLPYYLFPASIFTSKLAGVLAYCLSIPILFWAYARAWQNRTLALLGVIPLIVFLSHFDDYLMCWNRPEPFLMLTTATALLALTLEKRRAIFLLAATLALTLSLKPHIAAVFAVLLLRLHQQEKPYALPIVLGITVLFLGLISLIPSVSFVNYFIVLKNTALYHVLSPDRLKDNLFWISWMVLPAPILLLWTAHKHHLTFQAPWFKAQCADILVFFTATIPIFLAASKEGGGPWHLLPLLEVAVFLTLSTWKPTQLQGEKPGKMILDGHKRRIMLSLSASGISFLICHGAATQLAAIDGINYLSQNADSSVTEVNFLLEKYYGNTVQMGVSGKGNPFWAKGDSYSNAYVRPLLSFAGMPLLLDAAALMDISLYKKNAADTLTQGFSRCYPQVWLIPIGDDTPIFSLKNLYRGAHPTHEEALFSDYFIRRFHEHYQRDITTPHFAAYVCKSLHR